MWDEDSPIYDDDNYYFPQKHPKYTINEEGDTIVDDDYDYDNYAYER